MSYHRINLQHPQDMFHTQNTKAMKNLQSIAGLALITLLLTAGSSYAQRGNRTNRNNQPLDCYQNIPNLREEQNREIQELRADYLKEMSQYRDQRRSTVDTDKKDNIRRQMLQKQQAHRDAVRSILTDEQKTYFDRNYRQNNRSSPPNKGARGAGMRGSDNNGKARGGGNGNRR